jgi:hypothetical protein
VFAKPYVYIGSNHLNLIHSQNSFWLQLMEGSVALCLLSESGVYIATLAEIYSLKPKYVKIDNYLIIFIILRQFGLEVCSKCFNYGCIISLLIILYSHLATYVTTYSIIVVILLKGIILLISIRAKSM